MVTDVVGNLGHVRIIQSGIDFVKDEERGRLVAVHSEQKRQRRHRLFPSRKMLHVPEALERWHSVVFDAIEVGFVRILHVQVANHALVFSLRPLAPPQLTLALPLADWDPW